MRLLAFALPLLLGMGHAHGAMRSVQQVSVSTSPPVSCPQATDNGCAAAPANGSFKSASLLTSAQQSGQNSLLPTRAGGLLTLNIPGVDYGIGPDSTLTPKDPRTINDGVCAYTPAHGDVECFTGGPVVHEVLDNYDFSGTKIGQSPLYLYAATSAGVGVGSTLTVTNSYFKVQADPTSAGIGIGIGFAGEWNITFKNNQCDGASADANSDGCIRDDGDTNTGGTTFDAQYNVFSNQNVARVGGNWRYTNLTFKYNFVQGLNDINNGCGTCSHGEVFIRACPLGGCTGSEWYEGNFVIWNATSLGTINNPTFFPSTGSNTGVNLSSIKLINNIVVTNNDAGGHAQVGKALFNFKTASLGTVTITGNWMDATGSNLCGVNGTVQNGDGTASTSGNTITITSLDSSFNNNPIEIGYSAINPGFTTAQITALGTGGGGTGTYTFGGATQTQGSTNTWTFVPSYTGTPTISGNMNLADPSHTGTPTAVTFPLPTMLDVNCVGAH